jgi:hypothetical protein
MRWKSYWDTNIRFAWSAMDGPDHRRGIRRTPGWFGELIGLFGIVLEKVFYLAGLFPQRSRHVEKIHLVVSISDLVGKTARPCLDLVEPMLLLVVSRLTNVNSLVAWETSRSASVISRGVHHKAAILDIFDTMISVSTCLEDLVLPEALVEAMYCLFGSVIPTGIHPLLTCLV